MSTVKKCYTPLGNQVLESSSKNFYISFAYMPDEPENTALCLVEAPYWDQPYCFLNLIGDHRAEYEKLLPNLENCLKYYNDNKEKHGSRYSENNRFRMPTI